MIADTEIRSRLGRAGWRTVQERYCAGSATAKYISLFQSILERKGSH